MARRSRSLAKWVCFAWMGIAQVLFYDGFCITNDGFCIKNDEFCIAQGLLIAPQAALLSSW